MIERTFTGDYSLQDALKDITNVQLATSEFNDNTPMFDAMVNTIKNQLIWALARNQKVRCLKFMKKILALLSPEQLIKSNRLSN
jgi:hypothetical protein